jgi:hypothetical protein
MGIAKQLAGFILIGPHEYSVPSKLVRFDGGCGMQDAGRNKV